tara:strand:+ start:52 stop:366 length:315 start_codon:yes stop_codon:yes gene_type:complete
MKISKKRLTEIIKEEIEEAYGARYVDASTQRYAGDHLTAKPIDPFADEEGDPSVAKTVPSMRKTQVEDPDEPSGKVAEFLQLLKAQLSAEEFEELLKTMAQAAK